MKMRDHKKMMKELMKSHEQKMMDLKSKISKAMMGEEEPEMEKEE
jgi:hypothetical protein